MESVVEFSTGAFSVLGHALTSERQHKSSHVVTPVCKPWLCPSRTRRGARSELPGAG